MSKLNDIYEFLDGEENAKINLYFTRKAKSGYMTFSPNVDRAMFGDLLGLIRKVISEKKEYELVEFNPVGYRDKTVETCNISYVGNHDEILQSFSHPESVETGLNPDDLTFYCMEITKSEEVCRLFRRVTKFRKISSKGILGWFSGDKLNRMEHQMIGLDGFVDLIEYGDTLYILNHIALERIFRLEEEFSTRAEEALSILKATGRIENFEQFEEDCLSDHRYHKTLSKMLQDNEDLGKAFDHFENIREVVEMFSLEIELVDGDVPKIQYQDKSQRMDILRIINDAYYRSIIRERKGIDTDR
jgi:hypothetical protein|nr:MAG TPA: protein of unknown function (DUF4868) [Caudoviricetes sp.]